jgi:hypothetical protein
MRRDHIGAWLLAIALACVASATGSASAALVQGTASSGPEAFHARTRAAIREVLAQREFADLQVDENVFWQRLFGRIFGMVRRIFAPLTHLAPWILWTIVIWMLLTLAAILGHLIYVLVKLVGAPLQTAGGGRSAGGRPQDLLGIRDLDFDAVYAQAGRLVGAGDWAAATRYLYVAAILWLDRQGRIAFRSSKTNRDYLQELQPAARQQELFRRLTGRFEPIVYGGQAATKSSTDDMTSSVEGLFHGPTGTLAG